MNGESPMTDPREALVALVDATLRPFQVDPKRGPSDAVGAIADAILAAGWSPRGERVKPSEGDQWWESLVEAPCDQGHRVFIDDGDGGVYACPACAPPPTVKPSVEDVARAILMVTQAADVDPDYAWSVQYPEVQDELLDQARAVLALLPGRAETEVGAEAWDKGYMTGYRDRGREESYDLGANPYRQKEADRG